MINKDCYIIAHILASEIINPDLIEKSYKYLTYEKPRRHCKLHIYYPQTLMYKNGFIDPSAPVGSKYVVAYYHNRYFPLLINYITNHGYIYKNSFYSFEGAFDYLLLLADEERLSRITLDEKYDMLYFDLFQEITIG